MLSESEVRERLEGYRSPTEGWAYSDGSIDLTLRVPEFFAERLASVGVRWNGEEFEETEDGK